MDNLVTNEKCYKPMFQNREQYSKQILPQLKQYYEQL